MAAADAGRDLKDGGGGEWRGASLYLGRWGHGNGARVGGQGRNATGETPSGEASSFAGVGALGAGAS